MLHLISEIFRKGTTVFRLFLSTFKFKTRMGALGCSLGSGAKVDGKVIVRLSKPGQIKFGNNLKIVSRIKSNLVGLTNPTMFQCIENGKIEIGDDCGFSSVVLSSRSEIKIGHYVKIGGNTKILDHDFHSMNYLERREKKLDSKGCKSERILIEDDVFIGANCIILKGVKIGARSIIGAGAVVSIRNIPPDSIVAGNPAKVIRKNEQTL